jgi:superfamily II DNA or RNA helicase
MAVYVYIATTKYFRSEHLFKIGKTDNPKERMGGYTTGCPPTDDGKFNMYYEHVYLTKDTKITSTETVTENAIHIHLDKYKCKQSGGGIEWFKISIKELEIELVKIKDLYELEEVDKDDFSRKIRPRTKLPKIIKATNDRLRILTEMQHPIIRTIIEFYSDKQKAGRIVLPCGFGKTRVSCESLKVVNRVVILAPYLQIIKQWENTLIERGVFNQQQIFKNVSKLNPKLAKYCLIITYKSSDKLKTLYSNGNGPEVVIFDEAHHMGGCVSFTRGFLKYFETIFSNSKVIPKKLFLTATERYYNISNENVLSMNDESKFGKKLYQITLKECIKNKILPDYEVCTIKSKEESINDSKRKTFKRKIKSIIKVWKLECENFTVKLHHMIIFAPNIKNSKEIGRLLRKHLPNDNIIIIDENEKTVDDYIKEFEGHKRAIIVNCQKLYEGVDIPIADSVVFMKPSAALEKVIQTAFRAGRYYENKLKSYILIMKSIHDKETTYNTMKDILRNVGEVVNFKDVEGGVGGRLGVEVIEEEKSVESEGGCECGECESGEGEEEEESGEGEEEEESGEGGEGEESGEGGEGEESGEGEEEDESGEGEEEDSGEGSAIALKDNIINIEEEAELITEEDIKKWMKDNDVSEDIYGANKVASMGNVKVMEWLWEKNVEVDSSCMNVAAKNGRLDIIKWLYEKGVKLTYHKANSAAENGHIEVLDWLLKNGIKVNNKGLSNAARNGHLETIKWLWDEGIKATKEDSISASINGHLETVEWLWENDIKATYKGANNASLNGHLETVEWLWEKGIKATNEGSSGAAINGHLDVVKWLWDKNIKITKKAFKEASINGHLEIIKWLLVDKSVNIDYGLYTAILENNNEVSDWIKEQNFNYDKDETWVKDNGFSIDTDGINKAIKDGKLDAVKFLWSKGIKPDNNNINYAINESKDITEFLVSKGLVYTTTTGSLMDDSFKLITITENHISQCVRHDNLEGIKTLWKYKVRPNKSSINKALSNKYDIVVKFLITKGLITTPGNNFSTSTKWKV